MADNVALPASGVTAATDDIGGIQHQRVKVEYGADGSATDVAPLGAGLPIAQSYLELTGSVTATGVCIAQTDVRAYSWFSFAYTGGGSNVLSVQLSADGTNWVNTWLMASDSSNETLPFSLTVTPATNRIYHSAVTAKYLRVNCTSYASGTSTVTLNLFATGMPDVDKRTYVYGPSTGSLSDAASNNMGGLGDSKYGAAGLAFNGTTWDRVRAATAADATTGTGVPAAGVLGFDGTNFRRVKTDTTGIVQTAINGTPAVTVSGTAAVSGSVTADTELPAAAALADATANPTTPVVGAANEAYNGSTWDRARTSNAADATTGTGVPAAGVLGFDGTNYRRVATDTAGVVQTAVTGTPSVAISGTPAVTVSGTATVSGSVTADTELPAAAALADGTTNPTTPLAGAANELFNGSTWDRIRSAAAASNTSGTGLLGVGLLGWDGAAFQRLSTGPSGALAVRGARGSATSASVGVGSTGTIGPVDVSEMGNVTFTVRNTTAGSAFTGSPVIVFEQSDDNVSWAPFVVTRNDNGVSLASHTLSSVGANGALMLDGAVEGPAYVRARVTTGPTGNALTVSIQAGGLAFSPVVTSIPSGAATVTTGGPQSITAAAADTLILAANQARRGASIYNDATTVLYLSLGTNAASTTAYTLQIGVKGYYEVLAGYTGQIRGIWAAGPTGAARATEVTA